MADHTPPDSISNTPDTYVDAEAILTFGHDLGPFKNPAKIALKKDELDGIGGAYQAAKFIQGYTVQRFDSENPGDVFNLSKVTLQFSDVNAGLLNTFDKDKLGGAVVSDFGNFQKGRNTFDVTLALPMAMRYLEAAHQYKARFDTKSTSELFPGYRELMSTDGGKLKAIQEAYRKAAFEEKYNK